MWELTLEFNMRAAWTLALLSRRRRPLRVLWNWFGFKNEFFLFFFFWCSLNCSLIRFKLEFLEWKLGWRWFPFNALCLLKNFSIESLGFELGLRLIKILNFLLFIMKFEFLKFSCWRKFFYGRYSNNFRK